MRDGRLSKRTVRRFAVPVLGAPRANVLGLASEREWEFADRIAAVKSNACCRSIYDTPSDLFRIVLG